MRGGQARTARVQARLWLFKASMGKLPAMQLTRLFCPGRCRLALLPRRNFA